MILRLLAGILLFAGAIHADVAPPPWSPQALEADIVRLKPLAQRMARPRAGEWLSLHNDPVETFSQWLADSPVTVSETRKFIYVRPLGKFTPEQSKIVALASEHLGLFYGLEVKTLPPAEVSGFPDTAKRVRADGSTQYLTTHILDDVLRPALPNDAAFLIAFTAEDLWPGKSWNFVFGMASLQSRVGVWSLRRFGDPSGDEKNLHTVLRRAIKVATHESGHMFSMSHCVLYRCGMNGANSLPEADAEPLEFCPHCLAKLAYATKTSPRDRQKALRAWYLKNGFPEEAGACAKRLAALEGKPDGPADAGAKPAR